MCIKNIPLMSFILLSFYIRGGTKIINDIPNIVETSYEKFIKNIRAIYVKSGGFGKKQENLIFTIYTGILFVIKGRCTDYKNT